MKTKVCLYILILSTLVFLMGCTPNEGDPLLVFLVRHAEKVDQSKDPDLSPDGYSRAEELACVLAPL